LLSKLIEAINLTAIQIEAKEEIETLYQIYAKIDGFGKLYQSPNNVVVWPIVQASHASLAGMTGVGPDVGRIWAEHVPLTVSAKFSEPYADSLPQVLEPA